MAKQRCIKLYTNGTFEEKGFKIEENRLVDGKKKIQFKPMCKFTENKSRLSKIFFWRGTRTIMLFIEGALNALEFDPTFKGLQMAWGQKEAALFIKKMIALEATRIKPLKTWQFVVIIALLSAILFGVINLLMRLQV